MSRRREHIAIAAALVCVTLMAAFPPVVAQEQEPDEQEPLRLEARPSGQGSTTLPAEVLVQASQGDYRIGRQDLLQIDVFDVDELDQTVRVSEDGTISMPLLGRLEVAGLTKGELEAMIARLLEERFVRNPQVTVFVKEYESKKVAVSGAVKKPGSYEMLGSKTLLEMISLAGGLDSDLGPEIIIFRRNDDGTTKRVPIELERLVYDADPSLNVAVMPGDIIYVPTVQKLRIFVTGAVRNPDAYEVPSDEPVTVLKAITLAGGTTDRAAQKRVLVMRTDENGQRVSFEVNLQKIKRGKIEDPILREHDIVLVPEAFF